MKPSVPKQLYGEIHRIELLDLFSEFIEESGIGSSKGIFWVIINGTNGESPITHDRDLAQGINFQENLYLKSLADVYG